MEQIGSWARANSNGGNVTARKGMRSFILSAGILILFCGCGGTWQPYLKADIPKISVSAKIPLHVGLFVPESSRNFDNAKLIKMPDRCLSTHNLAPETSLGTIFEETVRKTLVQIFDQVSVVSNPDSCRECNFVIEPILSGFSYKRSCPIDPVELYIPEGILRVTETNGKEIFRSDTKSYRAQFSPWSGKYKAKNSDPNEVIGGFISSSISSLTAKWAEDLIHSPQIDLYAKQFRKETPVLETKKEPVPVGKLPPLRPDTYAVIIGIDYKGRKDIPNLQYPSGDAKQVYDILTDPRYGGVPKENALLLLNERATRNEMIAGLRKIKSWDGYVFVYYSGHGAPKVKGDQFLDGLLVPYDAVVTDPEAMEDTSIRISYLQDLVDTSQAKGILVALDACFAGGGKSIVAKGGKPLVGMLVSPELLKAKGTGKVVITSSAANQQSWEDDTELKGGIFSHYFLEGLKGKAARDVWVKVDDLAQYIKENVPKAARKFKGVEQVPQVSGQGDFAVTRNWERAQVMDADMARARLKAAFENGHITAEQLNKALDELKTPIRSKTLQAFFEGKIEEKKFGELY